ncbi:CsgG/HfaB family protein [Treponema sp. R80B11-R83G3]
MKKCIAVIVLFLVALSIFGQAEKAVSLDRAIQIAGNKIRDELRAGSKIVVYQFQSPNNDISNYVLKKLYNYLVNTKKFTVLDRASPEVIDAELKFQFQEKIGMISDDSLASLTKIIGAQAIITGSLEDTRLDYNFFIKAIGVETREAFASDSITVNKNDRRIKAFSKRPPTAGEKFGTGALNLLLGLGSYIEGDISGGLTLTGGYAVTAGLFTVEALVLNWDSPAVGIPGSVGFGVAGLTLVYGFARPFIYNHAPRIATVMDNAQIKIVQTSEGYAGNRASYRFSYTIKF